MSNLGELQHWHVLFTAAAQQKEEDDDKLVFDFVIVSTQQMLADRVKSALWSLMEANRQASKYAWTRGISLLTSQNSRA